jgi:hypothetical protein
MSMIIVPGQHRADAKPFAELGNKIQLRREAEAQIIRHLELSFNLDAKRHGIEFAKRHATDTELQRRTAIMLRWYRKLRHSGYGHYQTMDELPVALRAELDGENYTPPAKGRLWVPRGVN